MLELHKAAWRFTQGRMDYGVGGVAGRGAVGRVVGITLVTLHRKERTIPAELIASAKYLGRRYHHMVEVAQKDGRTYRFRASAEMAAAIERDLAEVH